MKNFIEFAGFEFCTGEKSKGLYVLDRRTYKYHRVLKNCEFSVEGLKIPSRRIKAYAKKNIDYLCDKYKQCADGAKLNRYLFFFTEPRESYDFKMDFCCYYNNIGFTVTDKYLIEENIVTGRTRKVALSPILIEELQSIKESYDCYDVNRTYNTMDVFDEYYDRYEQIYGSYY